MKKLIIACSVLSLLAVASCKKKEDDPSRKDRLTTGKWLQTASKTYTTTSTGTNTTDNYASAPACAKDDLSIFRTDNHLITDEGASKCDPTASQQTDEGIWSLSDGDSKLIVVGGGFSLVLKINALDGSTLELESADTTGSGSASTIERQVITFTHQN